MKQKPLFFLLIFFSFQVFLVRAYAQDSKTKTVSDSLGDLYFEKAKKAFEGVSFDSTFIYLEEALHHYQDEENWTGIVTCYVSISSLHTYQGDYLKRDSFTAIALDIAKTKLKPTSFEFFAAMNSEASRLREKGDYNQAIQYFKKVLSITKLQKTKGAKRNIANTLANLGDTYFKRGDYEEALYYFKESHQYHLEANGETRRSATLAIKIGDTFREKENKSEASVWYADAENILKRERKKNNSEPVLKPLILVLFQMADMALEQGDWENAIKKVEEAQEVQDYALRANKKAYVSDSGRGDDILGNLYLQQNDATKALYHFSKSRDLVQREFEIFEKHPLIAKKELNIARVYKTMGDWRSALVHYHAALEMVTHGFKETNPDKNPDQRNIFGKLIALKALKGKADSYFQFFEKGKSRLGGDKNNLHSAYKNYQLATRLIASIREEYLGEKSKEQLSTTVLPIFEGAIKVSLALYGQMGERHYLQEAYSYMESIKAIGLLESINDVNAMKFAKIPDSLLQQEKKISLDIVYYERLLNEEKQKLDRDDLPMIPEIERRIFNLHQQHNSLIETFENDFPKYYQLKYNTDLATIEKVQDMLNASNALIEYFVGLDSVYIFTITKNTVAVSRIAMQEEFVQNVNNLQQLINKPPSSKNHRAAYKQFVNLAHGLYQKLIPLDLNEKINELILIPDDILCQLSFDVLLSKPPKDTIPDYTLDKQSYLLEDFDISYSYSATILLKGGEENKTEATNVLAAFAPSFDDSVEADSVRNCKADKMYSLLCSEEEVSRIQDVFGGGIFLGKQANIDTFKLYAPQSQIIHLATHACIDENNYQFNKIYFADDYLSYNELYNLFFQSDLVVLSACNTGIGQLVKGEGVMSLSRGFIHAGCPSTVMSLWSVNDCATSDIMVKFYEYLQNDFAKNQALRLAKIDFLNKSNKVQNHPYYWAAFVQSGNTDKLESKKLTLSPSKLLLLSFAGLSLFLGGYFIWKFRKRLIIPPSTPSPGR